MNNIIEMKRSKELLKRLFLWVLILMVALPAYANEDKGATVVDERIYLPSAREVIDNCKSALTHYKAGELRQYYSSQCFSYTLGLTVGIQTHAVRQDPILSRRDGIPCFKDGRAHAIHFRFIQAIILYLQDKIKEYPELEKTAGHHYLIVAEAEKICELEKTLK